MHSSRLRTRETYESCVRGRVGELSRKVTLDSEVVVSCSSRRGQSTTVTPRNIHISIPHSGRNMSASLASYAHTSTLL